MKEKPICSPHRAEILADPVTLITVADRQAVSLFIAVMLELENVFLPHTHARTEEG